MHFNMKKAKFRRMSIISNSFDVRTSQRVKKPNHIDEDRKKDKQLLTPNIKRFLKTWLLDHKDYPYPDRYEKILLAQETGLTIMQICNWFANWRRKLKLYSKDFKRRSYKAIEDKTDSDEIEEDSDDTQHRTMHSWPSQYQHNEHEWNISQQQGLHSSLSNQREHHPNSNFLNQQECPHQEQVTKPKIWRPQEDLGIENKDLMLLKWLKSISTYDSLKYHPCYTKYAWDSDRVKQMLHGEADVPEEYGYDRDRLNSPPDHRYDRLHEKPYLNSHDHRYEIQGDDDRSGCDVHLDEVRQSDEILAAEILASFARNRHASAY